MKVITICGSIKFYDIIVKEHRRLAFDGYCVFGLTPPSSDGTIETSEQIELLSIEHYKKIDLSDAIFVVNKDGYIGDSTKKEIEYAKKQGKEIIYMEV
ncbi:MAG: DUF4406 domain-containing protein [Rickettsiales bacterium]|jgi:hypothetical protein|nr:DUF4406 domain-containing protein [Rickettsiales bacterium]